MNCPPANDIIEYRNIELIRNGKQLFDRYNLTVSKNEKILVSGKSGSGKTTLFKLLLGFDKPDRGCILFQGLPVSRAHILEIRQHIFYLSQDIDLRNQAVSALLNEVLQANRTPFPAADILDRYLNLLELMSDTLNQEVNELSGGERQRVGLLLGFLLNRPVWLLDEPTSALDDAMKEKIADYILNCTKTILVISHDEVWKNHCRTAVQRLS
jgi:putative ABC transport system ATP-binding protein